MSHQCGKWAFKAKETCFLDDLLGQPVTVWFKKYDEFDEDEDPWMSYDRPSKSRPQVTLAVGRFAWAAILLDRTQLDGETWVFLKTRKDHDQGDPEDENLHPHGAWHRLSDIDYIGPDPQPEEEA